MVKPKARLERCLFLSNSVNLVEIFKIRKKREHDLTKEEPSIWRRILEWRDTRGDQVT